MKTDDLINLLANGRLTLDAHAATYRLGLATGWGFAGTTLLMAVLFGVRADLAQAAHLPMFWAKLIVPAVAAATALYFAQQVSHPGARGGQAPLIIGALLVLTEVAAATVLWSALPDARLALLLGTTWKVCAVSIALLSLPLLAGILWALRGLAPTRPVLTGAAAGLFAGTGATAVYALHCPEMAAAFLGIWYVMGIAVSVLLGALGGNRVLRW